MEKKKRAYGSDLTHSQAELKEIILHEPCPSLNFSWKNNYLKTKILFYNKLKSRSEHKLS